MNTIALHKTFFSILQIETNLLFFYLKMKRKKKDSIAFFFNAEKVFFQQYLTYKNEKRAVIYSN